MTKKEAVKVIDNRFEIMDYCENAKLEEALDIAIKALEQSERKKGKWGKHGECPFCGYLRQWGDDKFCANCGARMER